MTSRQVVAVNMESDIYSLEDLEGKTIAVQTTTRPEKIFLSKTDERIPAIRSLIALQKRELIYPFLSKGYADALAAHETAIRQYMEDYNIKFRILDEPLETVGLGVAFDKNDDRGIEKQLTEILTDGLDLPLLDAILDEIPEPAVVEGTPQMLITSLEYSSYIGRIAVGKVTRGELKTGQNVTLAKRDGVTMQKSRIKELMVFEGLGKKKVDAVPCGEICALIGIDGFEIGDTICDYENPEPLPPIAIDEPTMSMLFTINNSPFFGKDGKYVTSRHIKERLDRELEKNLALRVEPGANADSFIVFGRGVLHLSVLIETMRREGYELQVGQPKVIVKEIDGKKCEPIEEMTVDCPQEYSGTVIELATKRKGTLTNMETNGDRTRLEFTIPSRGIIGLRSNMLTATAGEAIMTHRLKGFEPWTGEIEMRVNGSIISGETGTAYAYSIDKLQDRGRFFISPMEQVYEGQVIGEHTRQNDITVNVTKAKQLTNMRASGSDEKTSIAPPKVFSLEEALEYIKEDEYVEVTPHAMRLRKILLNETDRKRASK